MKKNARKYLAMLLCSLMLLSAINPHVVSASEAETTTEEITTEEITTEEKTTQETTTQEKGTEEPTTQEKTTQETTTEVTTEEITSQEVTTEEITTSEEATTETSVEEEEKEPTLEEEEIENLKASASNDHPKTGVILHSGKWGGGYKWYVYCGNDLTRHYVFCLDHGNTMMENTYTLNVHNNGTIASQKNTFRIACALNYFYKENGNSYRTENAYGDVQYAIWNQGGTDTAKKLITYANSLWELTELNSDRSAGTSSFSKKLKPIKKSEVSTAYKKSFGNESKIKVTPNNGSNYAVENKSISLGGTAWKYFADTNKFGSGGISIEGCYDPEGNKLADSVAKASVGSNGNMSVSFNPSTDCGDKKEKPITIVARVDKTLSGATTIDYMESSNSKLQRMSFDTDFSSPAYFAIQVYMNGTELTSNVKVRKVDEHGNPVEGCTFGLYKLGDMPNNGLLVWNGNSSFNALLPSATLLDTAVSNESGYAGFEYEIQESAIYAIKELSVPKNMKINEYYGCFHSTEETGTDGVKRYKLSALGNYPTSNSLNEGDTYGFNISSDLLSLEYTCRNEYERGSAHLTKNRNVYVSYENGKYNYKTDPYANVDFELYSAEDIYEGAKLIWAQNTLISTDTTDNLGNISYTNLPLGNYYLVEKDNHSGCSVSLEQIPFVIKANEDTPINGDGVLINNYIHAHAVVHKFVDDAESQTPIPLQDAEITLYANINNVNFEGQPLFNVSQTVPTVIERKENGEVITEENTWIPLETVKTDEMGTANFSMDLPYGTYMVVETKSPKRYRLPIGKSYTFTHKIQDTTTMTQEELSTYLAKFASGMIYDYTYYDKETSGLLTVLKKAGQVYDATLENTLYGEYAKINYKDVVAENVKFNIFDENNTLIATIKTDTNGVASISGLDAGKYYVQETDNGGRFVMDSEKKEVILKENALSEVEPATIDFTNMNVATNFKIYKEGETVRINDVLPSDVNSADNIYLYDKTEKLKDVVFGIYTKNDIKNFKNDIIVSADSCVGYAITNEEGVAEFDKTLPEGEYYYQEVKTKDDNYIKDVQKYDFAFKTEGKNIEKELNKENPLINKLKKGSIKVIKTNEDGSVVLEGVKFTLYDSSNAPIGTFVTDANGEISIKNLPIGTYYLQETETLEDYILDDELRTIDLSTSNLEQVVKISNEKKEEKEEKKDTSISIKTKTTFSGSGHAKTGDILTMIIKLLMAFSVAGILALIYLKKKQGIDLIKTVKTAKKRKKKKAVIKTFFLLIMVMSIVLSTTTFATSDTKVSEDVKVGNKTYPYSITTTYETTNRDETFDFEKEYNGCKLVDSNIKYEVVEEVKEKETVSITKTPEKMLEKDESKIDKTVTEKGVEYTLDTVTWKEEPIIEDVSYTVDYGYQTSEPKHEDTYTYRYTSKETGKEVEAVLPFKNMESGEKSWVDGFSAIVTFKNIEGEDFKLGNHSFKYNSKSLNLSESDYKELVKMLGYDTKLYRFTSASWDGSAYDADNGEIWRDAIATGQQYATSYKANYSGEVETGTYYYPTANYNAEIDKEDGNTTYTIKATAYYEKESFNAVPIVVSVVVILFLFAIVITLYIVSKRKKEGKSE